MRSCSSSRERCVCSRTRRPQKPALERSFSSSPPNAARCRAPAALVSYSSLPPGPPKATNRPVRSPTASPWARAEEREKQGHRAENKPERNQPDGRTTQRAGDSERQVPESEHEINEADRAAEE